MKPTNNNLVMQRMGAWVITELQKALGISRTMRLNVDPDDHRFWLRAGDGLKVLIAGDSSTHRVQPQIEITFDYQREVALVWVDDVQTLVRPEREFNPEDLPDAPMGAIDREVNLNDALELLEVWQSIPAKPKGNNIFNTPDVVGGP